MLAEQSGLVLVHCHANKSLRSFTINGNLLASITTDQIITATAVTAHGDMVVCGGDAGALDIYGTHDLRHLRNLPFQRLNAAESRSGEAGKEAVIPQPLKPL